MIGSDNCLPSVWYHTIIWTNDGLLTTETLETDFKEILIKIQQFSFKQMNLTVR